MSSVLGPAGQARLSLILDGACLERTDASFAGVAASDIFHIGPEQLTHLNAELGRYDNPDNSPTAGPVLVIQGSTDQDVPAAVTQAMLQHLQHLQQLGADVTERVGTVALAKTDTRRPRLRGRS